MAKHPAQLEQYDSYIRRKRLVLLLTGVLTLVAALLYLGIGSMRIPLREILRAFGAHIFFDDQAAHAEPASELVPSAVVPYREGRNPMK